MSLRPSSVVLLLLVATLPLVIWAEQKHGSAWNDRLAFPSNQSESNRHTPLITNGTFLPPTISKSITLTAAQNPVVITGTTTIPKDVNLKIEKGVNVFVHEYGQLIVDGTLNLEGTTTDPITFTTNEIHPANKVWGGIILNQSSIPTITHTVIEYASPAITCLTQQKTAITDTIVRFANTPIFNPLNNCSGI